MHVKLNIQLLTDLFSSCLIQFPQVESSDSQQYTVAVRLSPNQSLPSDALVYQQSARTRGQRPLHLLPSDLVSVKWNEIFFFKVDSLVLIIILVAFIYSCCKFCWKLLLIKFVFLMFKCIWNIF